MIFLEECVNSILMEEGQLVVQLDDLELTWNKLDRLFKSTFEQAKAYISIYDWTTETITTDPKKKADWQHVRHITYNTYNNMQRFMPDVPHQYWEFNPYTKNMSSLMSTNFSLEVIKYPTIGQLPFSQTIHNVRAGVPIRFTLPCNFSEQSFKISALGGEDDITYESEKDGIITLSGALGEGTWDTNEFEGTFTLTEDVEQLNLDIVSKYSAIAELDMTCELFYNWFKANVLSLLGAMKEQIDLAGTPLPFDFNKDTLLARGRELMQYVNELKATKQHWSNF